MRWRHAFADCQRYYFHFRWSFSSFTCHCFSFAFHYAADILTLIIIDYRLSRHYRISLHQARVSVYPSQGTALITTITFDHFFHARQLPAISSPGIPNNERQQVELSFGNAAHTYFSMPSKIDYFSCHY